MTALGGLLTLVLASLVLGLGRRGAALSIIAAVCYTTQGQVIDVAGFHFTAIRLVLLAGLIRVTSRGEFAQVRFNNIDRVLIAYALSLVILPTLRVGTMEELVYRLGCFYDICLSYFVFRSLFRDLDDFREMLVQLAYLIIPLALLMLQESVTGWNVFSVFGGVFINIRDGHVRSEGAFRSPITAGAFGATLAMLFGGMFFARVNKQRAVIGLVASIVIVMTAHSSGPLLGLMTGCISLLCWPWRRHRRIIRWSIVIAIVGLHLAMKSPVWFLLGRVSDVFGGGGYHRAYVIDEFVKRFGSLWLLGTSDTSGWMATELAFGGTDLTNQFVADGVNAGLVGLSISVMLIVRCFQRLGVALHRQGRELRAERLYWGIGSTLVGSIAILFSVTYFDQMQIVWYVLLAGVASVPVTEENKRTFSDKQHSSPRTVGSESQPSRAETAQWAQTNGW